MAVGYQKASVASATASTAPSISIQALAQYKSNCSFVILLLAINHTCVCLLVCTRLLTHMIIGRHPFSCPTVRIRNMNFYSFHSPHSSCLLLIFCVVDMVVYVYVCRYAFNCFCYWCWYAGALQNLTTFDILMPCLFCLFSISPSTHSHTHIHTHTHFQICSYSVWSSSLLFFIPQTYAHLRDIFILHCK